MGIERRWIEHAIAQEIHRAAYAGDIGGGIALVGIDHVQPPPIPQLHVDLAQSILVVTGDDEPPAFGSDFGSEVEWPLRADGFDDALAPASIRQAFHFVDDPYVIVHDDRFARTERAGEF